MQRRSGIKKRRPSALLHYIQFEEEEEKDNSGVRICKRCKWPYSSMHPGKKKREAHKKQCGLIEGYPLLDSDYDCNPKTPDEKVERKEQNTDSFNRNSEVNGSSRSYSEDETDNRSNTDESETGKVVEATATSNAKDETVSNDENHPKENGHGNRFATSPTPVIVESKSNSNTTVDANLHKKDQTESEHINVDSEISAHSNRTLQVKQPNVSERKLEVVCERDSKADDTENANGVGSSVWSDLVSSFVEKNKVVSEHDSNGGVSGHTSEKMLNGFQDSCESCRESTSKEGHVIPKKADLVVIEKVDEVDVISQAESTECHYGSCRDGVPPSAMPSTLTPNHPNRAKDHISFPMTSQVIKQPYRSHSSSSPEIRFSPKLSEIGSKPRRKRKEEIVHKAVDWSPMSDRIRSDRSRSRTPLRKLLDETSNESKVGAKKVTCERRTYSPSIQIESNGPSRSTGNSTKVKECNSPSRIHPNNNNNSRKSKEWVPFMCC